MTLYKIQYVTNYKYKFTDTVVGTFKQVGNLIEITEKKYWDSYHTLLQKRKNGFWGKTPAVYRHDWSDCIKPRKFTIPASAVVKIEEWKDD